MCHLLLFLFTFFVTYSTKANEIIKIAVIDTGYNLYNNSLKLCDSGHKDFTGTGLLDNLEHGQNISHIISNQLPKDKACLIMLKWTDNYHGYSGHIPKALEYAKTIKDLRIVNFSGGGYGRRNEECNLIKELQDIGIIVVVAAGNENTDLGANCNYFPACCNDKMIVVGNLNNDGTRNIVSNYGTPVDYWEIGTKVKAGGVIQTGTSQAAAVRTGKEALTLINKDVKIKKIKKYGK